MNKPVSALILTVGILIGFPATAEEANGEILRKALGCYQMETLLRMDELSQVGHSEETQRLGLDSIANGDCVLLEGRTQVFKEKFSDGYVCVRAAGQHGCLWVTASKVEV
jgi:hypothetical protein